MPRLTGRWRVKVLVGLLYYLVPSVAFDNSSCPCSVYANEIGTEWIPVIYKYTVATEYIFVDPDTNKRSTSTSSNPSASAEYRSITESLASSLGNAWANYDPATEPQSKPTVTNQFVANANVTPLTAELIFPTEYLVVFDLAIQQRTKTTYDNGSTDCISDTSQKPSSTLFNPPSIYATGLSPLISTFENQGRAVHYLTGLPAEAYNTIPGLENCIGGGSGIPTTKAVVRRLTRRHTKTKKWHHHRPHNNRPKRPNHKRATRTDPPANPNFGPTRAQPKPTKMVTYSPSKPKHND